MTAQQDLITALTAAGFTPHGTHGGHVQVQLGGAIFTINNTAAGFTGRYLTGAETTIDGHALLPAAGADLMALGATAATAAAHVAGLRTRTAKPARRTEVAGFALGGDDTLFTIATDATPQDQDAQGALF